MILELQKINFTFPGKNHLLDNVTLSLEEKKIYALMGANGCGKTTLFNLITGFLRVQSGNIVFKERTITKLPPFRINRIGINRTFQDLRVISKLTVKENILLAFKNNPTDSWLNALLPKTVFKTKLQYLKIKADLIIQDYFLEDVKHSFADEISYGQQKLLNLACCVANGASLLLLDEPVAGINPGFRNKIIGVLKRLKESGITILLIEHNTDFINDVADSIFFLNEGIMNSYTTFEKLKTDPIVFKAYI